MSQEDIIKYSGLYIEQQTKFGKIETNNLNSTTKGVKQYLETLTELNIITGAGLDKARENIDEQNANLAFQAKLRELTPDQAEAVKKSVQMYQDMGVKGGALTALFESFANDGQIVSDTGAKYSQVMAGVSDNLNKAMNNPKQAFSIVGNFMKHDFYNTLKGVNDANANVAKISADAADAQGSNIITYGLENKIRNTNLDLSEEEFRRAKEERGNLDKEGKDRIDNQAELNKTEMALRNAFSDLIYTVGNLVVPAMASLADVTYSLLEGVAQLLKFLHITDITDSIPKRIVDKDSAEVELKRTQDREKELEETSKHYTARKELLEKQYQRLEEAKTKHPALAAGAVVEQFWKKHSFIYKGINEYTSDLADIEKEKQKNQRNMERANKALGHFNNNNLNSSNTNNGNVAYTAGTPGAHEKVDANSPGAYVDPRIKKAEQQILASMYKGALDVKKLGWKNNEALTITSENDAYHKGLGRYSPHKYGRAADFVISPADLQGNITGKGLTYDQGEELIKELKANPYIKANGITFRNELAEPSAEEKKRTGWTYPHLHMEAPPGTEKWKPGSLIPDTAPTAPDNSNIAPLNNPAVQPQYKTLNHLIEDANNRAKQKAAQQKQTSDKDDQVSMIGQMAEYLRQLNIKTDSLIASSNKIATRVG